jgi:hypothetical protein
MDRAGEGKPELAVDRRLVLSGIDKATAGIVAEQALLDLERLGMALNRPGCQCRTNFPQKRRSKFPQVTVPP